MKLFLSGPMGSGKSTVGEHVARQLGCPAVDLDGAVEAALGARVGDIFEAQGNPGFAEKNFVFSMSY